MLAALGGTAGLLLAPWATRLLVASQSRALDIDTSLDARVLVFGLVVSVLIGVIVSQAPILATRRVKPPQASESSSAWGGAISRRLTAHDVIVALQIAMALAMLVSASFDVGA